MAAGATGTPTSNFSIPKYATSADAPNGTGFNSAMDAIDTVLLGAPFASKITGIAAGSVPVWDGAAWVKPTGTPDGTKFLRDDGSWSAATTTAPVLPFQLTNQADTNAFWTVSSFGGPLFGHWEFVKDVAGFVYGQSLVPANVTNATIRLVIAANATSGVTRLSVFGNATANGELIGTGWNLGNPITPQDITVPGTAFFRKDVTFSVTGLAGADLIQIAISHDGAHANDTLAVNTLLFGAWLEPA